MSDWSRVRCLDPQADLDILEALEKDLSDQFHGSAESRLQFLHPLIDTLSNSFQLSEPKPLLSQSPEADLKLLARNYLERPSVANRKRAQEPISESLAACRMLLSQQGFGIGSTKISAAKYTYPGDPLKIDCGYRPNGVNRLFHALPLAGDPDNAKVLAFSYPALAEGIARIERIKTDLTAIVEDDLDRNDEAIQFAIHTLETVSINVAEVRQLQDIAERARVEMRL